MGSLSEVLKAVIEGPEKRVVHAQAGAVGMMERDPARPQELASNYGPTGEAPQKMGGEFGISCCGQ